MLVFVGGVTLELGLFPLYLVPSKVPPLHPEAAVHKPT
jgi:hypothetical protein